MTLKRTRKQNHKEEYELYPKLRKGIDYIAAQSEEEGELIGMKDSWGLSRDVVWLSPDIYYLLQYFDGLHSRMDIQQAFKKKFNRFLFNATLDELIQVLDEHFFLDNTRTRGKIATLNKAYAAQPFRYPRHCKISYAEDPDQLVQDLDQYGKEIPVNRSLVNSILDNPIAGAVLPHIDVRLGGGVYCNVFKILSQARPADVYVILGIAHRGLANPFTLTRKDFQTPLGLASVDKNGIDSIQSQCSFDVFADEWSHGYEHSIEFPVVFLKHFIKAPLQIIPVLCSFPHTLFQNSESDNYEKVFEFIRALKRLKQAGKSICYLAAVDFAHVGPAYGGPQKLSAPFRVRVEQNDKYLLDALAGRDIQAFHDLIARYDNPFRICGYSALMTLLYCLSGEANGQCLAYSKATMDDHISLVTFAGMIFK